MPDQADKSSDEVDLTHAGQQITLSDLLLAIAATSPLTAGIMPGYKRSLLGAGIGAVIGLGIGVCTVVGLYVLRERLSKRLDSISRIRAEIEYCLFCVLQLVVAFASVFLAMSATKVVVLYVLG